MTESDRGPGASPASSSAGPSAASDSTSIFAGGLFGAAEVGIGVVIGYAAGPWLERQQKLREADLETVSSR